MSFIQGLEVTVLIIVSFFLTLFAKHYSSLKKRSALLRQKEVDDEIRDAVKKNDDTSLDDLVRRENEYLRSKLK